MKLRPSRIHYSQNLLLNHQNAYSIFGTPKFNVENLPKLQVFKKDGCYFALDNNSLSFYRQMELAKQSVTDYEIEVVLVASKKIPKAVLDASECSADEGSSSSVSTDAEDEMDSASESDNYDRYSEGTISIDDTTCLACGQKFKGIKELTNHQLSKKHFACYMCGEVYSSSHELKAHEELTNHKADFSSDSD